MIRATARWPVKEGDDVPPGDVAAETETDGAITVCACSDGAVSRLMVAEGDVVAVCTDR